MDTVSDELPLLGTGLAKDIVGEIVLAEKPEQIIKKWRGIFKISQKTLANELGITSSVVSDYESGRRKSPGIKIIKRYVAALLKIDARSGGQIVRSFEGIRPAIQNSDAIIDLRELQGGVDINIFCRNINASFVVKPSLSREIYGYTVIDSVKAITEFSFTELMGLYGLTTQRCLIFTGVSTGRSPMVAIKMTNLHPGLVVLHGLDTVDDVAKRIANVENIPLAVCRLENIEDIKKKLEKIEKT